jgi:sugar phosphate isomerase/epimerase
VGYIPPPSSINSAAKGFLLIYIGTNFPLSSERSSKIQDLIRAGNDPLYMIRDAELAYVEISLRHEKLDHAALAADVIAFHQAGLQVNLHPYYEVRGFGTASENPYLRPNLEAVLVIAGEIAQQEGRPVILNFHAASGKRATQREVLLNHSFAFHDWLMETAAVFKADVLITTEHQLPPEPNLDRQRIGDNFAELLDLKAHQPADGFGLCWDMGHSTMRTAHYGDNLFPPKAFLPLVKHVHIHDVDLRQPVDHCLIGEGDAPLGDFVMSLLEVGYQGGWTMEYQVSDIFGEHYSDFLRRSKQALLACTQLQVV